MAEVPARFGSFVANCFKLSISAMSFLEICLALAWPKYRTPGMFLGHVFLGLVFAFYPLLKLPPPGLESGWVAWLTATFLAISAGYTPSRMGMATMALHPS